MGLVNIVDERNHKYRFLKINVALEATWHDNAVEDSDKVEKEDGPAYEDREDISLSDAVEWANAFETPVTLYLYDQGKGITTRRKGHV
jgi:hypothetical protein